MKAPIPKHMIRTGLGKLYLQHFRSISVPGNEGQTLHSATLRLFLSKVKVTWQVLLHSSQQLFIMLSQHHQRRQHLRHLIVSESLEDP